MNKLKLYLIIINDKEIIFKSIKISLFVGTILNFINQGDKIVLLDFENINHAKAILTYIIPFLVSSYTALSIKIKFKIGEIASFDSELICKNCKLHTRVLKNTIVPICENCQEKTKWKIK